MHVGFTRGSYRRAEGKVGRSATGEEQRFRDNRLDAILARVILLDQISRNVFRGTEKAFVGDECALRYSKFIVRERLGDDLPPRPRWDLSSVRFYTPSCVGDHVLAEKFCRRMIEKNGANTPLEWTLKYILGHKEVLEMFGRYPHRNEILGRETTVEEAQWLVSAQVPRGPRVNSGRNSTIRIFKSLVERAACKIFVNRDDNTHRIRTLYKIQVFPSRSIKSHLFIRARR